MIYQNKLHLATSANYLLPVLISGGDGQYRGSFFKEANNVYDRAP